MEAVVVFPNQLYLRHPAIGEGRKVFLVEDALFFGPDPEWPLKFHAKKLVLMRSAMMAYGESLENKGCEVIHVDCEPGVGTADLLERVFLEPPEKLHLCDPVDEVLSRRLEAYCGEHGVSLCVYPSPNFLSPGEWLDSQFGGEGKPFMATFYKAQRKRMGILMDGDEPVGGQWSYDEANRKKLPKKQTVPEPPGASRGRHVEDAEKYVRKNFPDARGSHENFHYPVDRNGALKWLRDFFNERFHLFGDYEDAISREHRVIFHGVLTPVLNLGLLQPGEVVDKALEYASEKDIPLNSVEGFIRQIIGWREFMRAMYERHGNKARTANFWKFKRRMPECFYTGTTGIEPVDETIRRVIDHAYCHHIERLMVLGNFMLLCRIHPDDVYAWFMEYFIDAYDWVMVPNVYGMSQFADGGMFTTKPYISGSNYIRKMSDFKKGPWCDVWDGLFWTFIEDHLDFFSSNHRLSRMAHMFSKMEPDKKERHRRNATEFLETLDG